MYIKTPQVRTACYLLDVAYLVKKSKKNFKKYYFFTKVFKLRLHFQISFWSNQF